jgi:hypothetical protein
MRLGTPLSSSPALLACMFTQHRRVCTHSDDVHVWQEDPTVPDPKCPLQVGLTMYTGMCVEKRMLNGDLAKVCT